MRNRSSVGRRVPAKVAGRRLLAVVVAFSASCDSETAKDPVRGDVSAVAVHPDRFGVGRPATASEIAAIDIDVNPRGEGLPPGSGTWTQGATVYAAKCAVCHGPKGEGTTPPNAALVGRSHSDFLFASDRRALKTVGNYWPWATTLFDYIRRAMPQMAPGSLTADETYAVIAWLLAENGVIGRDKVIDATSLPAVAMPARDRFVKDDRTGGAGFR
ncbi:MAG: c-type cytochrome [Gemmatimonadota bacterium]